MDPLRILSGKKSIFNFPGGQVFYIFVILQRRKKTTKSSLWIRLKEMLFRKYDVDLKFEKQREVYFSILCQIWDVHPKWDWLVVTLSDISWHSCRLDISGWYGKHDQHCWLLTSFSCTLDFKYTLEHTSYTFENYNICNLTFYI